MQTQDNIEPSGERDERYELLCSYVLGETDAEQSRTIEAELAQDPALRAEQQRLATTIGLVREFGQGPPSLSETARAKVASAGSGAAQIHRIDWHAKPLFKLAAAALVAVGAAYALLPRVRDAANHGFVYRLDGAAAPASQVASSASSSSSAKNAAEERSRERRLGGSVLENVPSAPDASAPSEQKDEKLDALLALGYESGGPTGRGGSASFPGLTDPGNRPLHMQAGADAENNDGALGLEDLRSLGYVTLPTPSEGRTESGDLDLFLGKVKPQESAPSRTFESSSFTDAMGAGERKKDSFGEQEQPGRVERVLMFDSFELNAELESSEREMLNELGLDEAESSLRELLQGMGYLDVDFDGSLDSPEVLALRRQLLEAGIAREKLAALLDSCHRRPGETLEDMFFRHWGTRPAVSTADDPLSTFSIDVDTASYTLARGMLERGILPTRAQVRAEEFINYFRAEVPSPTEGTFALAAELAPNPFGPEGTWLMRAVVRAKDVSEAQRDSLALTFVVDVSGSMATDNRIGLVKDSMRQLLTKLDGSDRVAILAFAKDTKVVLPMTSADQRARIEAAIASLETGGGTNVESGLLRGYELASAEFDPELQNRVVLLSDGVGNIGETNQDRLLDQVAGHRVQGLYLNTIGFGISNHNDVFLEQLADGGDGICNYVDSPVEARRAFVDNFTGAFQTVARDVKIQVEFDPAKVGRYRLIGYENRAIADREFRNDKVDAGEVGAGQEAVAVYELFDVDLSADSGQDLATLRVRFKQPFGSASDEQASELELRIDASAARFDYSSTSTGFRKSTLVAQLAEVLRRSRHAGDDSMHRLASEIQVLADQSSDPDFRQLAALFERNRTAIENQLQPASEVQGWIEELKFLRYELEREREAEGEPDAEQLAKLERSIEQLEQRIRSSALSSAGEPGGER